VDQRTTLLLLADLFAQHEGITHFAVSMRALGKGDFFLKLGRPGAGCHIRTAERLMRWFSDRWPSDLEWPADIPRPPKSKQEAA
jgi:hypothetical protein